MTVTTNKEAWYREVDGAMLAGSVLCDTTTRRIAVIVIGSNFMKRELAGAMRAGMTEQIGLVALMPDFTLRTASAPGFESEMTMAGLQFLCTVQVLYRKHQSEVRELEDLYRLGGTAQA